MADTQLIASMMSFKATNLSAYNVLVSFLRLTDADFMGRLYFPKIHERRKITRDAFSQTADWLFTHPNHIAWEDSIDIAQHHGLLWIKGKPGSGKSTLVKTAFLRMQSHSKASGISTAAFFFNARSTQPLEKAPMGLYRSLLYQYFESENEGIVRLYEEELRVYLKRVLVTQTSKPAVLFIDAVDECDDEEARDLVGYFSRLTNEAFQLGANLKVCLSSRHYPQISIDGCPEIAVERHNKQDIFRFIQAGAEDYTLVNDLQQDIANRYGGVFLWVVLVVSILKKSGRGKSSKWLKNKLNEIPRELITLFKTLFSDVDTDELPRAINFIRLMPFSKERLTWDQILIGLNFSLHALASDAAWRNSVDYFGTEQSQHEMII
ncbi:hypothetical protein F5B21DRAFT_519336 [Xylaria acuta]|nr:hypothetical protein F5B21DRAFT_519336 [Xylaria acuta]